MAKYALQRLISIFPTLVAVLSILFILTKLLPGDPVLFFIGEAENTYENTITLTTDKYNLVAESMGLDQPLFYFSIVPVEMPRAYFSLPLAERKYAKSLISKYKSPVLVTDLVSQMASILHDEESQATLSQVMEIIHSFPMDLQGVTSKLDFFEENHVIDDRVHQINQSIKEIISRQPTQFSYLPKLVWHGWQNQYHAWIVGALTFDIGVSRMNGKSAWSLIADAIPRTLAINIISILAAYFFSILIGVYAGWWEGPFDSIISFILYVIYSVPGFWMATILVVFFSTSEYGTWTNLFPSVGIWETASTDSQWQIILKNVDQLIIPVLVLSTSFMAYLTRIVRNSVIEEKHKTYVAHARNKGLSERDILWRHVFRNASFPLITLLASIFPAALAGSVVIEFICNVPGIGRLLYDSIIGQDWPIVIGVVMISAILTLLGLLISDILYRWADPRVNFGRI